MEDFAMPLLGWVGWAIGCVDAATKDSAMPLLDRLGCVDAATNDCNASARSSRLGQCYNKGLCDAFARSNRLCRCWTNCAGSSRLCRCCNERLCDASSRSIRGSSSVHAPFVDPATNRGQILHPSCPHSATVLGSQGLQACQARPMDTLSARTNTTQSQ